MFQLYSHSFLYSSQKFNRTLFRPCFSWSTWEYLYCILNSIYLLKWLCKRNGIWYLWKSLSHQIAEDLLNSLHTYPRKPFHQSYSCFHLLSGSIDCGNVSPLQWLEASRKTIGDASSVNEKPAKRRQGKHQLWSNSFTTSTVVNAAGNFGNMTETNWR